MGKPVLKAVYVSNEAALALKILAEKEKRSINKQLDVILVNLPELQPYLK